MTSQVVSKFAVTTRPAGDCEFGLTTSARELVGPFSLGVALIDGLIVFHIGVACGELCFPELINASQTP